MVAVAKTGRIWGQRGCLHWQCKKGREGQQGHHGHHCQERVLKHCGGELEGERLEWGNLSPSCPFIIPPALSCTCTIAALHCTIFLVVCCYADIETRCRAELSDYDNVAAEKYQCFTFNDQPWWTGLVWRAFQHFISLTESFLVNSQMPHFCFLSQMSSAL